MYCAMGVSGIAPLMAVLGASAHDILHDVVNELRALRQQVTSISLVVHRNDDLEARVADLEAGRARRRASPYERRDWKCPVCNQPLKHRESFKGHIRRLIVPSSDRTHCFLDIENPAHRALLAHPRYGDGDFNARAVVFSQQLYDTVKSNSSSTRTSESSHSAVSFIFVDDDVVVVCVVAASYSTSHIDCRSTHGCLREQLPVLLSVLLAMVMDLRCSCFCGALRYP